MIRGGPIDLTIDRDQGFVTVVTDLPYVEPDDHEPFVIENEWDEAEFSRQAWERVGKAGLLAGVELLETVQVTVRPDGRLLVVWRFAS